jgi:hypothetical protein
VSAGIAIAPVITHATPMPSAAKGRAALVDVREWSERLCEIRTCQHCKTIYKLASWANRCEHYHEGL